MTRRLCSDQNPRNMGMRCSLPPGHTSRHAMGDGATWPLRAPEETSVSQLSGEAENPA